MGQRDVGIQPSQGRGPHTHEASLPACASTRPARSRRRGGGSAAPARAERPATRLGTAVTTGPIPRTSQTATLFALLNPGSFPLPPDPGEMLSVPSTASSTTSSSLSMAAATLPSTGRCAWLPSLRMLAAAGRALGLSACLASLEEAGEGGGGRGGAVGAARDTSPYSPFNSSACRSRRPHFLSPRSPRLGVLPPQQLSLVIPPLCYGAADPLTSPGAGALPPSLIDSSLSFPRSEDP